MTSVTETRIMYTESKAVGLTGPARIGRVTISTSDLSIYYGGKVFRRSQGIKHSYCNTVTGNAYWISGYTGASRPGRIR